MVKILIIIYIGFYILKHLIDIILEIINLKHLDKNKDKIPEDFQEHIEEEKYKKSIKYNIENIKLNIFETIVAPVIFLTFIYSGILNKIDLVLYKYINNEIIRGIVLFNILHIISTLINLPLEYYKTFVIEEKFGFNKYTLSLWITDIIKSIIISIILLSPLSFLIIYFIKYTALWWLYGWITFLIYQIFIIKIYPLWIVPLFNKLTPLEQGDLKERIEKLSKKLNFPINHIFIIDESKRTKHHNAFFSGIGKTYRLILYDSLIKDFNIDEIEAIVAHEIGHYKKKHILKSLIFTQILVLAFFYLAYIFINNPYLYKIFLIERPSSYMGILLISFIGGILISFISPVFNLISWKFEKEADIYSALNIDKGENLIKALIKLAKENFSNLTPHPLYARYYYTHPPVRERIKYIREELK